MSNFQNNPGYNAPNANGQYAVMTPPPRQEKRALPLAYTAGGGLIVGIVAGLLLISAGPETRAVAAPAASAELDDSTAVKEDVAANETAEQEVAATEPVATEEPPAVDPVTEPAAVDPATEPADVVPQEPEEPEAIRASLTFEVTPADLKSDIKIEIDGESITSDSFLLMLDPKNKSQKVQLTASAEGYRDFQKSLRVTGDMSVPVEMRKIVAKTPSNADKTQTGGSKTGGTKRGGGKSSKNSGPGGLLDL